MLSYPSIIILRIFHIIIDVYYVIYFLLYLIYFIEVLTLEDTFHTINDDNLIHQLPVHHHGLN